jgi:hypothetical protein
MDNDSVTPEMWGLDRAETNRGYEMVVCCCCSGPGRRRGMGT